MKKVLSIAAILCLLSGTAEAVERIDINSATVDELSEVECFDKEMAQSIASYREKNGPFKNVVQFMMIPGMTTDLSAILEPEAEGDKFTINMAIPEELNMEIFDAPVY